MTFRISVRRSTLPRVTICAFATLLLFCAAERISLAGELEAVRDEVRSETTDDDKDPPRRRRSSSYADCDDDPPDLFDRAFVFTTTAPWWLPRLALADDGNRATFPPAPYAQGHPGYLVIDAVDPAGTADWAVRLSSEYGTDFDDLTRIGSRLRLDTSSRIGFDTTWNQWLETTGAGRDRLSTGDFNLTWRFAQHERMQFHTGVGFNWLADERDSDFGVNFTYGVDAFIKEPFVLSAEMDIGSLGRAFFFHVRPTAGVIWGPAEIFTGYDYQRIGDVNLHGLLAGVQLWF